MNGKSLHERIRSGEGITITRNSELSFVGYSYKDNAMLVGEYKMPKEKFDQVEAIYNRLKDVDQGSISTRVMNLETQLVQGGNHVATEEIKIGSQGASLALLDLSLESPKICLKAQTFNFRNCFVHKSKTFELVTDQDNALIKRISITFDEESKTPCMLNGAINLVTGVTDNAFAIFGAKKVVIQCNEKLLL